MKVREYSIGYDGHGLVAELETLGGLYRIHSVMIPEAAGRDGTGSIALQRRDSDDFQAVQEWETHPRVGCTLRMTAKWLAIGLPTCACGLEMEQQL